MTGLTAEEVLARRRSTSGSIKPDNGALSPEQILSRRQAVPSASPAEKNAEEMKRMENINSMSKNERGRMNMLDTYGRARDMTANMFENMGNAMDRRRRMAADIIERQAEGEQNLAQTTTQMIGKVGVGATFDLMGEVMIAGAKGVVSDIPDEIQDPIKKSVAEAGVAFMNTDMGKDGMEALADGVESYQLWKQDNPAHAATFEGIVNIGFMATMGIGPKGPVKPSKAGQGFRDWAGYSERKVRRKAAEKVTQPKLTKSEYARSVVASGRTQEKGLARRRVDALSRDQAATVDELMKVPLKPTASYQKNFEIVGKAVKRIDDQLTSRLKRIKTGASQADINNMHAAARLRVNQSPTLAGDPLSSLLRIKSKVTQELGKHGRTPYGVLKARRAVDDWLGVWKQGKRLSDDSASALQTSIDAYRTSMNQLVAKLAPNQNVTPSLARMKKLMDARDAMHLKIAFENRNMVSRAFAKLMGVVSARTNLVGITSAALGTTYMLASGMVAPLMFSAPLFAVGYLGTKAAVSPKNRKLIGNLIDLSKSTAVVADKTRAERVYLQQFLDETASPDE